jgi:hypothetical protein
MKIPSIFLKRTPNARKALVMCWLEKHPKNVQEKWLIRSLVRLFRDIKVDDSNKSWWSRALMGLQSPPDDWDSERSALDYLFK